MLQRGPGVREHTASLHRRAASDHREHWNSPTTGYRRRRLPTTADDRQRDRRATVGRRQTIVRSSVFGN